MSKSYFAAIIYFSLVFQASAYGLVDEKLVFDGISIKNSSPNDFIKKGFFEVIDFSNPDQKEAKICLGDTPNRDYDYNSANEYKIWFSQNYNKYFRCFISVGSDINVAIFRDGTLVTLLYRPKNPRFALPEDDSKQEERTIFLAEREFMKMLGKGDELGKTDYKKIETSKIGSVIVNTGTIVIMEWSFGNIYALSSKAEISYREENHGHHPTLHTRTIDIGENYFIEISLSKYGEKLIYQRPYKVEIEYIHTDFKKYLFKKSSLR